MSQLLNNIILIQYYLIMLTFTRLLYVYDEVRINLLFSLLQKKNFNEVIFWSSELFYSGFLRELYESVLKIYYDFYSFNTPFYKIKEKLSKFKKTNEYSFMLEALNILFQSDVTSDIFIITHMTKYKKISKINNFQNIFKIIHSLIKKKKLFHIFNYLKAALIQNQDLTIENYNIFIQNFNEKSKIFKKKHTSFVFSQLLIHLILNTNLLILKKKKKRIKYAPINDSQMQYFKSLNFQDHSIETIKQQRKYSIQDMTSVFTLERYNVNKPLSDIFWYHWEYYSKNTPYWFKKYKKYNVKWNENKKTILFSNDDTLEDFYEHYDYELDELPFETSNKSIKELNLNISILEFLYKYFTIINIPLQKNKIDIKKRINYYANK